MKIIAFEGLDKSGKHTQSKLLISYLKQLGYTVSKVEFPRYETSVGRQIKAMLQGKIGMDKPVFELLMALDKQMFQAEIKDQELSGTDILILDRYILSQQFYALANGMAPAFVHELQRYMQEPDMTLYLDISAEESLKRKGKFDQNDRYESDLGLLERVRDLYLSCKGKSFYSINGMRSVDEVKQDVQRIVHSVLMKEYHECL